MHVEFLRRLAPQAHFWIVAAALLTVIIIKPVVWLPFPTKHFKLSVAASKILFAISSRDTKVFDRYEVWLKVVFREL